MDDTLLNLRLLEDILSDQGYRVLALPRGDLALRAAKRHPPDLVLLDIMMPEMDGQTALRSIRAIEKERGILPANEAKVIMTTALDDPKNVVEAYYKGGATSYVPKPIDKHMLLHLLKNLGLIE